MPSIPGPITGTLTVHEYGFGSQTISSQLSGVGGEPALAPSPGGAEAHPVVVGARDEPMAFSVFNVAFNPVKVRKVTIEGANPDDFQVGKDECSNHRVDASAACNLEIVFSPTASGRRTANVVVSTVDGAYTTMLVSGEAHWEPKLAVSTTSVVAPAKVTVIGAGFSPNTPVWVSWADGAGRPMLVSTDGYGGILADLSVRANDRPGSRTLVAQTTDGQLATADLQVVVPRRANGPNSARWPHG
jgi:hypothetical protein